MALPIVSVASVSLSFVTNPMLLNPPMEVPVLTPFRSRVPAWRMFVVTFAPLKVPLPDSLTVPSAISVVPVRAFEVAIVSVPAPDLVRPPVPVRPVVEMSRSSPSRLTRTTNAFVPRAIVPAR